MDFESPDDLDARYKRTPQRKSSESHDVLMSPPRDRPSHKFSTPKPEEVFIKEENIKQELDYEEFDVPMTDSDQEFDEAVSENSESVETSEDGEDEQSGFTRLDEHTDDQPVQSLYLMEKSNKKRLVIKDGKIVGKAKAQRKDKGKPRFTAYMMWARNIRQEILKTQPDMDFAAMSKRLGELWATVPSQEKFTWKRRAKRANSRTEIEATSNPKMRNTGQKSTKVQKREKPEQVEELHIDIPSVASAQVSPGDKGKHAEVAIYKVTGTQPIDVAAHLELLGESLRIIGERLKEHEVIGGRVAARNVLDARDFSHRQFMTKKNIYFSSFFFWKNHEFYFWENCEFFSF